jgi:hypothetical protein
MSEVASLHSIYTFGLRTSQAIFAQDLISLTAEPLFDRIMRALSLTEEDDEATYRALRVIFRFVLAIALLRVFAHVLELSAV